MDSSFVGKNENDSAEVRAFPAHLAGRVNRAVQLLVPGQMHPPSDKVIPVRVAEEELSIPYRVYYDKRQLLNGMDSASDTALIALCLGTRHYDGFIREQCVRRLLAADEAWTAPFLIQLLGEYVVEIIQPIDERFLAGVERKYLDFLGENAGYCAYLECRAISYWNEYYRRQFPSYKDYPAVKALAALKAAAKSSPAH